MCRRVLVLGRLHTHQRVSVLMSCHCRRRLSPIRDVQPERRLLSENWRGQMRILRRLLATSRNSQPCSREDATSVTRECCAGTCEHAQLCPSCPPFFAGADPSADVRRVKSDDKGAIYTPGIEARQHWSVHASFLAKLSPGRLLVRLARLHAAARQPKSQRRIGS